MSKHKINEALPRLFVEGKDDLHVVSAICRKFQLPDTFQIIDCEGVDNLLDQIPIYIKLHEPFIGILIDADSGLEARWHQLTSILTPFNYEVSDSPDALGTIIHSDLHRSVIGVWIMPNNKVNGMLEDFAHALIPTGDETISYAERAIITIQESAVAKFSDIHRSKALIHTWLAWQESPGTPMGLAITKSYLDYNHDLCLLFVKWLNRLFNPSTKTE